MSETLILKSINGNILTDKLINAWLNTNEIFITSKTFSDDRRSVELTFVDEERAEMMLDLLTTCYSNCISIQRPQESIESLNNSFEDERLPSPIHLSSATSISSKFSYFSQRLVALDKKNNDDHVRLGIGRGQIINNGVLKSDLSMENKIYNNTPDNTMNDSNITSTMQSIEKKNVSSGFGRGRGSMFQ